MSAAQTHATDAVAFQLLAALDRYESSIEEMLASWPDLQGYSMDSVQVDDLRLYSAALPHTSVGFVTLLISRSELLQCLFRKGGQPTAADVAACSGEHAIAIANLRRKCVHLLAKD
jgi:hypothetical protein